MSSLTDADKRILDAMWMGLPMDHGLFVAKGFTRGVQTRQMQRLASLGFVKVEAMPCKGHEHDWRTTGQYITLFTKLKEHGQLYSRSCGNCRFWGEEQGTFRVCGWNRRRAHGQDGKAILTTESFGCNQWKVKRPVESRPTAVEQPKGAVG